MEFKEFVQLLHPVIGAGNSTHAFARSIFDAIVTEEGQSVLEEYTNSTFKAYFNGNTGISKLAKKISAYVEPEEFSAYFGQFSDAAIQSLCDSFEGYLPNITPHNAGEELAGLFAAIIKDAASAKKKSAPKDAEKSDTKSAYDVLSDKILTSGRVVADALGKAVEGLGGTVADSASTASTTEDTLISPINVDTLSSEDLTLLRNFRTDSKDILIYIIQNDPAAGPTEITLSDKICDLVRKWQYSFREIEDRSFRNLVIKILKALDDYTYYISERFLRLIPERNILWFRNESWEEGNRLRNELQPKSYELRCEITRLYEKLYPIPEDQNDPEYVEAEVVDDEEPSGAADGKKHTDARVQVINNPTIVNQYGEKNIHIDHVDTLNL